MATRVPFQRPRLPALADIERYFAASRAAGRYSNSGPCHDLLVERARSLVGGRTVVAVSSGGIGLIVAIRALAGLRPDGPRQVIVPSFTFAATAAAIVWAGLEPVFCDIEPEGWHLCPQRLREMLAERAPDVAAIVACTAFGTPAPRDVSDGWTSAAQQCGVPLIVDSAAGLGAATGGPRPHAEVFSMHATKPMAVGEAGLVALATEADAAVVRTLINHGLADDQEPVMVGLNGKLDEWSCATALAAMDRHEEALAARRAAARATARALEAFALRFQAGSERSPMQFQPVLMASAADRADVLAAGRARGVELRTYYSPALHDTPAYGHHQRGPLDVTQDVAARILSLPVAEDLSADERAQVVACFGT